jgi:hypothetical protein
VLWQKGQWSWYLVFLAISTFDLVRAPVRTLLLFPQPGSFILEYGSAQRPASPAFGWDENQFRDQDHLRDADNLF